MKKEKKIRVAILSGEGIEICFGVQKVVYLFTNRIKIKDVFNEMKSILEDGENERLVVEIKEVSINWYQKIKPLI